MTELEKAARMALEAISDLKGYRPDIDESITALRQALTCQRPAAQTELEAFEAWARPNGYDLRRNAVLGHYSSIDTSRAWDGFRAGRASLPAPQQATPEPLIVKGAMTGMVDAQVRDLWPTKKEQATTERKGEPIGEIVRSFGAGSGLEVRLFGGLTSDTPGIIGTKLYTSPQVPEDADPLQGAVNWLCEARLDVSVDLIQQKLHIGYNRAKRLFDAARKGE